MSRWLYRISVSLCVGFALFSCTPQHNENKVDSPKLIGYSIQSTIPHDPESFTQGLEIYKGQLFESTGREKSWIGIVDVKTGKPTKKVVLDDEYFGEGITILNNKVYQLTWQNKVGFVYSLNTFKEVKRFAYDSEGWGLTHDGVNLIMSDGTDRLYYLDSADQTIVKTIQVKYQDDPVSNLNELEYVNGFIFANIWKSDLIAKIDATTGIVEGFIDLSQLSQQARLVNPNLDVPNGIAWHPGTKSLLVTGKNWPFIYVLRLTESPL